MDAFSLAYFIAVGLFVLTIWTLLIVDVVGPGLGRLTARITQRLRIAIHRRHAKHIHTLPRTDRS
jgi:hypothetical protein